MRSRLRLALVAGSYGFLAACGAAQDVTGTSGAPPASGPQSADTTSAQHATTGPSQPAGGTSQKPGGGGDGAPITIPNIIIKQGLPIDEAKSDVEAAARAACGYLCVTVKVDASGGQCVGSYTSNPPVRMVDPSSPGSDYIVQRGTRITLLSQQCSSPETSPSSPETSPSSPETSPS
jgi:hypothetical protein